MIGSSGRPFGPDFAGPRFSDPAVVDLDVVLRAFPGGLRVRCAIDPNRRFGDRASIPVSLQEERHSPDSAARAVGQFLVFGPK